MSALAVVMRAPRDLEVCVLDQRAVGPGDAVIGVEWSGVSTGTERLLWSGEMPPFPGMGYPLVPGYEAVGRVLAAPEGSALAVDERVFVPGSTNFVGARGLFGAAANRLIVPASKVTRLPAGIAESGLSLALAATAEHAIARGALPDLIVGHGALGRLLARITVAMGGAPVVWESDASRRVGAEGYSVIDGRDDHRHDYRSIYDASGDAALVDGLIGRLARGGELVLAGFYRGRLGFDFVPAFLREVRLRVAAEFRPEDLAKVVERVASGSLSLDGIVTHQMPAREAADAYRTAFEDHRCLKMAIDWRTEGSRA
jgi:3-hydroxyethyl bacteriochlorophyllide a dehydrogenase